MPRPPRLDALDPVSMARNLLQRYGKVDLRTIVDEIVEAHPDLCSAIRKTVDVVSAISKPVDLGLCKNADTEAAPEVEAISAVDASEHVHRDSENPMLARLSDFSEQGAKLQPILGHGHRQREVHQDCSSSFVQFGSAVYFCAEREGRAVIDVIRIGPKDTACTVEFVTEDGSAKAGVKYRATRGVLHFQPGEDRQAFEVEVFNNHRWDATLEFKIHLVNNEGIELGRYLYHCRVRIIDGQMFPSNRYRKQIQDRKLDEIPRLKLLWEYLKMNLRYKEFFWNSILHILYGQILNAIEIGFLVLNLVLVDVLAFVQDDETNGPSKMMTVYVMGGSFVALTVFRQFLKRAQLKVRADGHCRLLLQANIIRKFINYEEDVRLSVREADIINTINGDCVRLVNDGLIVQFQLIEQTTLLIVVSCFQIWTAAQSASGDTVGFLASLFPSVAFPIFMLMLVGLRAGKTVAASTAQCQALKQLVDRVEEVVVNVKLFIGFQQRPGAIQIVDRCISVLNAAVLHQAQITVENLSFAPLLASILTVGYIIYGVGQISDGHWTIGELLAVTQSIALSSSTWNMIYEECLKIQTAIPDLITVTFYMNLPTDLDKRLALSRGNGEAGRHGLDDDWDKLDLRFDNIRFAYTFGQSDVEPQRMSMMTAVVTDAARSAYKLGPWSLSVPQGSLTALVGPHGEGKTTLLGIVAGTFLPCSGVCFVPHHLRVYFVPQMPMFFEATLYENLTFGSEAADSSMDRVLAVCRQVGVDNSVIRLISKGARTYDFMTCSASEKMKLHLCRALIANPEVLVMARPMALFSDEQVGTVHAAFREHMDERGLALDSDGQSTAHLRRPRTVLFSASRQCHRIEAIYSCIIGRRTSS
eukprot:TRINITY_DN31275_c1_g1_i2.p1 TRINITY_DN31275_c1_g1~~TRINITY_DN31275_c1_g1_i2.p1  ORF type:complete len:870 (-),score=129.43 TRINITY_DN31275_c1_g1_i2:68-2677(-)